MNCYLRRSYFPIYSKWARESGEWSKAGTYLGFWLGEGTLARGGTHDQKLNLRSVFFDFLQAILREVKNYRKTLLFFPPLGDGGGRGDVPPVPHPPKYAPGQLRP